MPYPGLADHLGVTPKALNHRITAIKKTVLEKRANTGISGGASANETEGDEVEPPVPALKKRKRAPAKKNPGTTPTKKGGKKAKIFKSDETIEETIEENIKDNAGDEQVEAGEINDGGEESKLDE